ncbi:MAG: response regulator FixJ [Gammaproteobacteria bacterium]|jgi:two-component system, LuxR family, response regulator FixJ
MNSTDSSTKSVVFIVDDDEAMRNSLRWLIESVGHTVETYASAQAFLDNHYPGRSGCLLLDVRMPGMSGLELQSQLDSHDIRLPVIILTGHGDVGMAVKAMKAGALDFIEKPFDDELLLAAIEKALNEDAEKREERASQAEILARMGQLTKRESQVMEMVTNGKSNKEIAADLNVSAKTVEAHRAHVMEKMQAGSLAELVRMAMMVGAS